MTDPISTPGNPVDEPKSLLEALLAFQAEAPVLIKDETAEVVSKRTGSKYSYKYAAYKAIKAEIQPLLTKYQLVWTCLPGENEEGRPVLDYMLAHVPSKESTEGMMPLLLAGQDAQSHGSALTYARRYALVSVLDLVADDDDDGKAASTVRRPTGDARPLPKASREKMLAEIEASDKDLQTLLTAVGAERVEDVTVGTAKALKALL